MIVSIRENQVKKPKALPKGLHTTTVKAGLGVLSIGVIGAVLVLTSRAATPTVSIEVENGTVTSPVEVLNDSSASGGSAVTFQSSTGGNACAPYPSFPDANCTGVPPGTVLTPSGAMNITVAGTIINARDINGPVVVNAPNVTIRNSRITTNTFWVIENNSTGLLVENSEISNKPVMGQNNCHNGIGSNNFTLRQSEISGCENGVDIGGDNVTLIDNYIHDLDTVGPSYVWGNEPHTDGIQIQSGSDNLVIRHNWIDPSPGSGITAGIIMGVSGSSLNVTVEENYIDGRGASYAMYVNRQPSTNIFINRNYMGKGYGYTACVKIGVTVTEFNGNKDLITGASISPDNGADGGCTN